MSRNESSPVKNNRADVSKLIVLMITAFIDMVGTLMIIPLTPFYAKQFGANGLVVGLLVSSFSIAQLVSAPIWGRFLSTYPEVHLELAVGEAPIDIVAKGFDAGIGPRDRAPVDMIAVRVWGQ